MRISPNGSSRPRGARRGAIVVLSAFIMVFLLGLVAFAVDMGYILLVKTELQAAADSAALAAGAHLSDERNDLELIAQNYAQQHRAGGQNVALDSNDIQYGVWDQDTRVFTPTAEVGNALRVTARRDNGTGGNGLFFAKALGIDTFNVEASAVALGNPRDIVFVVDLSGSMNNDTEPGYSGSGVLGGGYADVRTDMMEQVFSDLGFGPYPGQQQDVGQPLGVSNFNSLSSSNGPLKSGSIPKAYRIKGSDSSSQRKAKAYKWMIDYQIAAIMPAVLPAADSANAESLAYWSDYLDAVVGQSNSNEHIGYRAYVQFLMDQGRDGAVGNQRGQLSVDSPYCAYHTETVGGTAFSFPAREQPTHACRRSLIAAIQEIKEKNESVPNPNHRDWVAIVTFDRVDGTQLVQSLTGDYDQAMQVCTTFQAVSDNGYSTATETGLIGAKNHLQSQGRANTQKVVVLLTDGMPNLKTSSNSTIGAYRNNEPSDYFYGGSNKYNHDAALMQVNSMQLLGWNSFAVGVGLGTDGEFMDRMTQMATQDEDAQAPQTSGDPAEYEAELRSIFEQIIDSTRIRLVQ